MEVSTIKIKHENGYCWINQEDFDESKHTLFEDTQVIIDLNTATIEELSSLPTIGKVRAKTIVASRPFESLVSAKEKLNDLDWDSLLALVEVRI
jgi:radical SAM superfamily enzyme with C-terminal helix-hairpin-helix motif